MMIGSLAKGGRVLDEPRYTQAATRAARVLLDRVRQNGRLFATYRQGRPRFTAYASDYAFLIEGLIELYETDFDARWLDEAAALMDTSIQYYFDEQDGGFFFTANDADKLLARPKQRYDAALPSSNSAQAMNLVRLAALLNRPDYRARAESIFRMYGEEMRAMPFVYEKLWSAVDFYHARSPQVGIIGEPTAQETKELLRALRNRYLPNHLVALASDPAKSPKIPWLSGRVPPKGKSAAYVGADPSAPAITSPVELLRSLEPS
jgi:hypothetical protein